MGGLMVGAHELAETTGDQANHKVSTGLIVRIFAQPKAKLRCSKHHQQHKDMHGEIQDALMRLPPDYVHKDQNGQ